MPLTPEEILHVAKLARLRVDPEAVEAYRTQLESVLGYVAKLQELNTDGVEETARGTATVNVFREDEAIPEPAAVREGILANFPRRQGDLLEVQAVFEDRTE